MSKLPYITIGCTDVQQLIEIEPILVMLGYNKSNEEWNNEVIIGYCDKWMLIDRIVCYSDKLLGYHLHWNRPTDFHATEINKIIEYVESYKKVNSNPK